jgi:HEAT repeat protein
MDFIKRIFGGKEGPSEGQIKRALKHVIQSHGDPSVRVGAMERLGGWRTPEAARALLRRFTIQVPQASMDQEEKQYTVRLLAGMGRCAVEPILDYLRTEPEVTYPTHALREILPREGFLNALKGVLDELAGTYTRWPEAKTVLIEHLPDEAFPQMRETVLRFLHDDDDDVCIAAAHYLARNGDDEVRERLLQVFLDAESRPRVRGSILDFFCEREWPVKGYRKKMEEAIFDPYYLTGKGTVKRRSLPL